jgi:hypothetical protein
VTLEVDALAVPGPRLTLETDFVIGPAVINNTGPAVTNNTGPAVINNTGLAVINNTGPAVINNNS